jgi:putative transposase
MLAGAGSTGAGAGAGLHSSPSHVPIGLAHDGANHHDKKLLEDTLASVPIARPIPSEQCMCLDRGYDYHDIRELVLAQRFEPHIRARGEEIDLKTHNPDWKARRWVAEARHSWLNRNRGILIR